MSSSAYTVYSNSVYQMYTTKSRISNGHSTNFLFLFEVVTSGSEWRVCSVLNGTSHILEVRPLNKFPTSRTKKLKWYLFTGHVTDLLTEHPFSFITTNLQGCLKVLGRLCELITMLWVNSRNNRQSCTYTDCHFLAVVNLKGRL